MQSSSHTTPSILRNLVPALMLSMSISSCQTTKTIPLETLRHDTLYINKEQYDSIYITRTSDTDRTRDTITITKTMTEYRYKHLRDTIYKTRIDSIPYEVIVYKDSPSINHGSAKLTTSVPSTINLLGYLSFGILIGIVGWKVIKMIPSRR